MCPATVRHATRSDQLSMPIHNAVGWRVRLPALQTRCAHSLVCPAVRIEQRAATLQICWHLSHAGAASELVFQRCTGANVLLIHMCETFMRHLASWDLSKPRS
jgi:hypothetical protein